MAREPGLYPTTNLSAVLSETEAGPGDPLVLTIEGPDVAEFTRGKLISIEARRDGGWQPVGAVIVRGLPGPTMWKPVGSPPFAMTMEGHGASGPMHFEVPPIPPGAYRVRIDATTGSADDENDDLRRRTATLYAELRVVSDPEG